VDRLLPYMTSDHRWPVCRWASPSILLHIPYVRGRSTPSHWQEASMGFPTYSTWQQDRHVSRYQLGIAGFRRLWLQGNPRVNPVQDRANSAGRAWLPSPFL